MQFINYFFVSIISFLGLLIGTYLVQIAPEEQKPLEKNFFLIRKIFLLLIFVFLVYYFYNSYLYLFSLIVLFIFLLFIEFKINNLSKKSIIIYLLLGVLFFLSSKNINLFTVESSLILLYGLPTASLIYKTKEKNYNEVLFYNMGFIIAANLLFLL